MIPQSSLGLRPETNELLTLANAPDRMLIAGTKTALRDLARRWKTLADEIKTLDRDIEAPLRSAAPELLDLHGVSAELAGQFLVTTGDNPETTAPV